MTGNFDPDGEPTVGSLLANLRTAARLSQEELAERAGVSVRTVRNIERGAVNRPWPDSVRRLAEALELSDDVRESFETHYRDGRPVAAPAAVGVAPHQLPLDVDGFHGRSRELAGLDALLDTPRGSAVPIAAIVGTGGVGKSALAVHWAHRIASRFPDGQLWIDLRGFDPDQPVAPEAALASFVRALGFDPGRVPTEPAELEALYRSLLDSRRMLVVVDNARDAEHVRPLLPGSGSCLVLVTSRHDLGGLVVRHGAHRIDLDVLPSSEALALLTSLIGDRAADDPDAIARVAERCARLPLALRIAAEFAVAHPALSVADLAANLADTQRRLEVLDAGGDPRAAVRSVFAWSYVKLDPDAARTFRLLGLHPGPDIDAYAVASLTETTPDRADRVLDRLTRAHLVREPAPGRFALHDLLRAWATERAREEEPEVELQVAQGHLLDYYRDAAAHAVRVYAPGESTHQPLPDNDVTMPDLADIGAATTWLDRERPNLLAIAVLAARRSPECTNDLSNILHRYLASQALDHDAETLHRLASEVVDGAAQAGPLNRLATVYWPRGRYADACATLERALVTCREGENQRQEGSVLANLGIVYSRLGRYDEALECARRALSIMQATGDYSAESRAHIGVGVVLATLGRNEAALDHFRHALTHARAVGNTRYASQALGNLGCAYEALGQHADALEMGRQYLETSRDLGDRGREADALNQLARAYRRLRRYDDAMTSHREALAIAREIDRSKTELETLNDMAQTLRSVGDLDAAADSHRAALGLAEDVGHSREQARAHDGLATTLHDLGDTGSAIDHWQLALSLYDRMGVPEADQVRERLARSTPASAPDVAAPPGRRTRWRSG